MPAQHRSRHPLTGDPPTGDPHTYGGDVLAVQAHLTDRDRLIIDWVNRHGVLTTAQLTAAFFTNPTTAAHRLAKLRDLRLLDRFHRPAPGAWLSPWHWVIGPLGATITAAADGTTPPTPRALRARHAGLANSVKLPHLLGVNQFFIDLHVYARTHPHTALVQWWSEAETITRFHGLIHPDGHALWRHHDTLVGVFVEHDRGTEPLSRLVRKLSAYNQLTTNGGPTYPILFWLPNPTRETNLHRELAQHVSDRQTTVATAVASPDGPGHSETVSDLHDNPGRWALHQLPCDHGNPNSVYSPAVNDPAFDPPPHLR
ncbi:MAG: hypothetical protein QG597_4646 [Actinomycetota bacterium]|nr:hypothetical protein [Actinomycetota bacterium]